jgi:protein O-GlcNAc transferase
VRPRPRFLPALAVALALAGAARAQEGHLARGEQLLSRGDFAGAEAELRLAVRDAPGSASAHAGLALALLSLDRAPEAVQEARRAVELDSSDMHAAFVYGLALNRGGRPAQAAKVFGGIVSRQPGKSAPLLALAMAYAGSEDPRAARTFEEVLRLSPRDPQVRVQYATYLWERGNDEEGNRVMEEALSLAPEESMLAVVYGQRLVAENRFLDAIRVLQGAVRKDPRNARALWVLGNAQWEAGRVEDATRSLEAAAAANPKSVFALFDLGRLLVWRGLSKEAIPRLEDAARLHPGSPEILLELGRARDAAGDAGSAEEAYRKAIALAPDLSGTHFALGKLLLREGRRDEGARELDLYRNLYEKERRRKFEQNSRRAELDLARVELRKGNAAGALERFRKLPESVESLDGEAAALSKLGRHREAIRALERAAVLAPDDRHTRAALAQEYELAGRKDAR